MCARTRARFRKCTLIRLPSTFAALVPPIEPSNFRFLCKAGCLPLERETGRWMHTHAYAWRKASLHAHTRTARRPGIGVRRWGKILQTILAFAPIFFPREKDGEDTRAKGREKMNLRSKLTRRSYSSRTSFLGYVRGKDYHYVGRIDSFRFSPSSPGVGRIMEEKSTSSMRHR